MLNNLLVDSMNLNYHRCRMMHTLGYYFRPNPDIQLNGIALINSLFMRTANKKVRCACTVSPLLYFNVIPNT